MQLVSGSRPVITIKITMLEQITTYGLTTWKVAVNLLVAFYVPTLVPAQEELRVQIEHKGVFAVQHLETACFNAFHTISSPAPLSRKQHLIAKDWQFTDHQFSFTCQDQGFNGFFAPERWTDLAKTGPIAEGPTLSVENGEGSLIPVVDAHHPRFTLKVPSMGYFSFNWTSDDALPNEADPNDLIVSINGRPITLLTGRTVFTPTVKAGDELTFELNPAVQGCQIYISDFAFHTSALAVIERHWTHPALKAEGFVQYIAQTRPNITRLVLPSDVKDGKSLDPKDTGFPYFSSKGRDTVSLTQLDCSYDIRYKDVIMEETNGLVIHRHWTVYDLCGGNEVSGIQRILPGNQPPTQELTGDTSARSRQ